VPLEAEQRAGEHHGRERVFALVAGVALTALAGAVGGARLGIQVDAVAGGRVAFAADAPRAVQFRADLAEQRDERGVLELAA